jgi:hypothetical protein
MSTPAFGLGTMPLDIGLRAGQTIAATYPAAVIGMAVLRVFTGSIFEENIHQCGADPLVRAGRPRPALISNHQKLAPIHRRVRPTS